MENSSDHSPTFPLASTAPRVFPSSPYANISLCFCREIIHLLSEHSSLMFADSFSQ